MQYFEKRHKIKTNCLRKVNYKDFTVYYDFLENMQYKYKNVINKKKLNAFTSQMSEMGGDCVSSSGFQENGFLRELGYMFTQLYEWLPGCRQWWIFAYA